MSEAFHLLAFCGIMHQTYLVGFPQTCATEIRSGCVCVLVMMGGYLVFTYVCVCGITVGVW